MNEVIGTIGIIVVLSVITYGIYIISKPHKFQI
jgi:hypothetical protein